VAEESEESMFGLIFIGFAQDAHDDARAELAGSGGR
jgi:hypothetical protein